MINFLLPRNKKKKRIKVSLCVIGKKENLYVNEYINHYKKLGYRHIFLYDNNAQGNSNPFIYIIFLIIIYIYEQLYLKTT